MDQVRFCNDVAKFENGECARSNEFYAHRGIICENPRKTNGNCNVEEIVTAVNLGTKQKGKYIDRKNYSYWSDDEIPYEEMYGTKNKWNGAPIHVQGALNKKDRVFYETIVHGNARDKCLTYKIKLWQNGRYELAVKVVEPSGIGKMRYRVKITFLFI